jgi:uncharacterized protein YecE (DUF72 family)
VESAAGSVDPYRGPFAALVSKQYLLDVASRCAPLRIAVELRHKSWFEGDNQDIYERFGYRYSKPELAEWAPRLEQLSAATKGTHVLMNNCFQDYAQTNAEDLLELLGQ